MANIFVPTPLRRFTNGNDKIEAAGETVAGVLSDLVAQ